MPDNDYWLDVLLLSECLAPPRGPLLILSLSYQAAMMFAIKRSYHLSVKQYHGPNA
jgi:hypothetical protein